MSVTHHVRSTAARQDDDSPEVLRLVVFDKRRLIAGSQMRFLSVGWNRASEDVGSFECRLKKKNSGNESSKEVVSRTSEGQGPEQSVIFESGYLEDRRERDTDAVGCGWLVDIKFAQYPIAGGIF
ncbi:unnamed protein product [Pipistrellus nathusii]|uniref:Uncharacterized protein n=1 Tax=Pipistrellus nathusii TaxID=59473 RepID=A0ABN9ZQA2_PIPNA